MFKTNVHYVLIDINIYLAHVRIVYESIEGFPDLVNAKHISTKICK